MCLLDVCVCDSLCALWVYSMCVLYVFTLCMCVFTLCVRPMCVLYVCTLCVYHDVHGARKTCGTLGVFAHEGGATYKLERV